MKKLATAFLLLSAVGAWAQKKAPVTTNLGYEIKVTLKPFKNQYIYLGHYYGKQLPIIDSVRLNENSEAVFKGGNTLGGGIYLIGFPDRSNRFEFLVGKEQRFSITADTMDLNKTSFVGSSENTAFKAYQDYMVRNGRAMEDLNKRKASATGSEVARLSAQADSISKKVLAYRTSVMTKDPNGLLATLLK